MTGDALSWRGRWERLEKLRNGGGTCGQARRGAGICRFGGSHDVDHLWTVEAQVSRGQVPPPPALWWPGPECVNSPRTLPTRDESVTVWRAEAAGSKARPPRGCPGDGRGQSQRQQPGQLIRAANPDAATQPPRQKPKNFPFFRSLMPALLYPA